jgi:hypothetical protein
MIITLTFLLHNLTIPMLVMVVHSFHCAVPCSMIVLHNKWYCGVSMECSSGSRVSSYSCIAMKTNRLVLTISLAIARNDEAAILHKLYKAQTLLYESQRWK